MQLTQEQKDKILAIVSTFETGTPKGDYSNVTFHKHDLGQLTYGRHQTTLASGNLAKLIQDYVDERGAIYGPQLAPYLDRLKAQDPALNHNQTLRKLLKDAGSDPVMRSVQDEFFTRIYWRPAQRWAEAHGFTLPLSMAVIYDSFIHSGSILPFLRNRFPAVPPVKGGKEKEWVKQYVNARHNWLANHSNALLPKTVYRTQTFKNLIQENNWNLDSPLKVRSFTL